MITLEIGITAEDDKQAVKHLRMLLEMMDVSKGEKCEIQINDAGYTTSDIHGSSMVDVKRENFGSSNVWREPEGNKTLPDSTGVFPIGSMPWLALIV